MKELRIDNRLFRKDREKVAYIIVYVLLGLLVVAVFIVLFMFLLQIRESGINYCIQQGYSRQYCNL